MSIKSLGYEQVQRIRGLATKEEEDLSKYYNKPVNSSAAGAAKLAELAGAAKLAELLKEAQEEAERRRMKEAADDILALLGLARARIQKDVKTIRVQRSNIRSLLERIKDLEAAIDKGRENMDFSDLLNLLGY